MHPISTWVLYQSTFRHNRMLISYRFEDWLHIQLYAIRCHLWLRYHQVICQMDSRSANSRGIFWTPGKCHRPGRSHRCRRNCWSLRCGSPCYVQAGFIERQSQAGHWKDLHHHYHLLFLWPLLRDPSAKVFRYPGCERVENDVPNS